MEFLIGGVAVIALLAIFFQTLKVRQARRFNALGGTDRDASPED